MIYGWLDYLGKTSKNNSDINETASNSELCFASNPENIIKMDWLFGEK